MSSEAERLNERPNLPLNPMVFMILLALAESPAHGYEIKKRAEAQATGAIQLDAGSLYRKLAHLESQGLVRESEARPDPDEDDARRKYYELTTTGRSTVASEARRLAGMVELARERDLLPSAGGTR